MAKYMSNALSPISILVDASKPKASSLPSGLSRWRSAARLNCVWAWQAHFFLSLFPSSRAIAADWGTPNKPCFSNRSPAWL